MPEKLPGRIYTVTRAAGSHGKRRPAAAWAGTQLEPRSRHTKGREVQRRNSSGSDILPWIPYAKGETTERKSVPVQLQQRPVPSNRWRRLALVVRATALRDQAFLSSRGFLSALAQVGIAEGSERFLQTRHYWQDQGKFFPPQELACDSQLIKKLGENFWNNTYSKWQSAFFTLRWDKTSSQYVFTELTLYLVFFLSKLGFFRRRFMQLPCQQSSESWSNALPRLKAWSDNKTKSCQLSPPCSGGLGFAWVQQLQQPAFAPRTEGKPSALPLRCSAQLCTGYNTEKGTRLSSSILN